uniref:Uncharacterized protein n=2 Tax=Amphimedon queenslandica TaxID=400682 RepID=A0A1X7VFX6_AMPQE
MYAKGGTKTNMATGVDLQKAVRQLISSVTSPPSGSQSKVLSLEDAVANLETTDENFHSYDLVKYVHGQIESVVDPLIDERLKKHGGLSHGEEHDIVALITDDILTSPEYTELCQSTVCEVKDSVDLLLHSDIPDSNDLSSNATSLSGGSSRTQYYPLDDSDTSELSSLKETGLFFIPHDHLIDITDQLKPNRTNEVRLGALQQLHQFPPGDLPQCDTWSSLSSSLEDCIMSDCNSLADSSLKLLSRMFDSTTSYKAREVYRILLCGLVTYFRGPGKANIETGLDPSTETNTKLLQRGIELLEGSGLIGECINHMRRRYQLKLQVSQCEKFGYGYMVSEVASTSTGITHLINSGYVCDLVDDLWVLLNGSMSCDVDVIKRDPFDPADRVMYKSIINILNVISSYPAFHKSLLSKAPPKTASTDVVTVSGLLEALVFKYGGTEEPMTAVRNNNDAHLCGLRIISILTTSLDSFVLLDTQFSLRETIASFQHACRLENNEYIIDACSVERNRLLVSSSCIGGPKERLLPPHTLTTISDVYEYPFYVRLKEKVPDCYTLKVSYSHHKLALNIKPSATINDLKSCYMKHLKQHTTLSTKDVSTLLVQSLASLDQTLPQVAEEKASGVVSPSSGQDVVLNLMLNYSKHIGLSNISKDSLWQILQKFNSFTTTPSQNSADWFVVIVSLILLQSHDQSCDTVRQFLRRFSSSATSLYVWRQRENLKPLLNFDTSKIHTFILHYIEFIIQAELPLVYSAFRLSGYTPSQVCQDWLGQCFLNYLDWPEICLYLINCILLGADYQVYFCVAIFKHLEASILKSCQEHTLLIFLKEEPLRGFTTKQSLSFMSQLELKYRSNMLKDLQTVQP